MKQRIHRLAVTLPLLAIGCSPHPQWPGPEETAAQLTGAHEAIAIDMTGGQVDATDEPGETLAQAQAVDLALKTSPDIQAALARVRLAYAEAHQERLLPNPILTVLVKFPTAGGAPTVEPGIAADLLALVQKPGKVKAADYRLRAASADAVTAVLDTLAEVHNRYAEIQALESLVPVLEERQRLLDRLLAVAESRLKGGEGTRLDVTTLETQRIELQVEATERALELREARLQLARLLGRPNDAAQWRLEEWVEPRDVDGDEREWVQTGLEFRPEVSARVWELSALGVELRQASWGIGDGAAIGAEAEGTADSGADDWAVGPSFTVPIPVFDWGQAKRDAATARQLEAAHQLNQIRRQVVEETRRAHTAFLTTSQIRRRVVEQLIPSVERRRQEAESQYRAGQSDVVPLILADQDLLAARTKLIELQRQTSTSLARLHRAVGGPGAAPSRSATQPTHEPQAASFPTP